MDTDGTGEIDMQEFSSEQFVSATNLGAKLMKGLTVDVLQGERPSHQKHSDGSSFVSSPDKSRLGTMPNADVHQPHLEAMIEIHQPKLEKHMEQDKSGTPLL